LTLADANVSVGTDGVVSLAGSQVKSAQLVDMLEVLKREALSRSRKSADDSAEGLSAIPGMHRLKELLLEEVVAPLRDPEKYKKYRISIPNGILLYGPPGCGKTFIAQRLAGELGYNFFEISPSSIGSPYVHQTGLKIRDLFDNAAKKAPVVIFVDEFEGMVPARSQLGGEDQYKAEEVNEWLVQINNCADRGILFIAATNEPWKIDEAVRRTGRIDKKIYVGPPDGVAILEMLSHHLKGRPVQRESDLAIFGQKITGLGYSASDIKVLADEAAKMALKANVDISIDHLMQAAAERVPPSITRESEEFYMSFGK
jgi:transitional endoplasmic reticulum ATPase